MRSPGNRVLDRLREYAINLDLALIGVWLVLCLALLASGAHPGAIVLDLVTAAATALTAWRPRYGIVLLTACLAGYLVTPIGWQTIGQYLPLLAILGTGLRDQRRERLVLTAITAVWLMALVHYRAQGTNGPEILRNWALWLGLIAISWLIGNAYAAAVRSREESRKAELLAERHALARELHDSTARTLSLTSLRAQKLQATQPSDDLDAIIDGIDLANQQLRWTLSMLREDTPEPATDTSPSRTPLSDVLHNGVALLHEHGFEVILTVQGDLAQLEADRATVLAEAATEAIANMIRHGDPSRPSSILATVEPAQVELVFLNHPAAQPSSHCGMGLAAADERLRSLGGRVDTQEGPNSWLTKLVLPRSEARRAAPVSTP